MEMISSEWAKKILANLQSYNILQSLLPEQSTAQYQRASHKCPTEPSYAEFDIEKNYDGTWRMSASDPYYNDTILFCPYCGEKLK